MAVQTRSMTKRARQGGEGGPTRKKRRKSKRLAKPKKVGKKGCHTVYSQKGAGGKIRYYYIKYTRVPGTRNCTPQPNYKAKMIRVTRDEIKT